MTGLFLTIALNADTNFLIPGTHKKELKYIDYSISGKLHKFGIRFTVKTAGIGKNVN